MKKVNLTKIKIRDISFYIKLEDTTDTTFICGIKFTPSLLCLV